MRPADIIAICVCVAVLLSTVFLADQRGLEAASLQRQIASLEQQIRDMRPVPRITVERASIYPVAGEVVVETVK